MTEEDKFFLESVELDVHEWRGVRQLAEAIDDFEPLAKRGNLGKVVADRLVERRVAEKGEAPPAYKARGMSIGYRLTTLGWKLLDRGRTPRIKRL